MTPTVRITWLRRMALLAAVLLYLALALPQLALPGLHYDEAKEAGVNAMEMLLRQDVHGFRSAGVQVGAWFLPIMVQDYIGALNVYAALPFLALLGIDVPALRLTGVAWGLGTLILVWKLGRELAVSSGTQGQEEGWTGEIAVLLLAASPTFVFWSRQGIFVTNAVVTIAVATVWMGVRLARRPRPLNLYLFAVLAGLGLWTKLLFVWVLGALAGVAAAAWIGSRALRRAQRQGSALPGSGDTRLEAAPRVADRPWRPRHLLTAAALFLLALSPLILFNQQTGGTLISIFGNLGQSYYGVDNAAFLANLQVRWGQLVTLLRSDHLWYLGEPIANAVAPWLALAMFGAALALAIARSAWREVGRLTLAGLFVLLLLVQTSFTVSDLFITHFAILQPFVVLLVAMSSDSAVRLAGQRQRAGAAGRRGRLFAALMGLAVLLGLGGWLVADLRADVHYHRSLAATGGYASHSDAVYRLAAWLDQRQVKQPLALDWGLDAPLRFLTQNRVEPLEIFGYDRLDAPDPAFAQRAAQFMADPTRLYLARMPEDTVFRGRKEALDALAASQDLTLVIEEAFHDRSGRVMFVALRAEPVGPAD